jgi:hypothetical protein
LQEDLLASAELVARLLTGSMQSDAEAAIGLAAALARQAAVFERSLRGAITFADLFGDDQAARLLRARLASTHDDRTRMRGLLDQVASGNLSDEDRRALWSACASIPSIQKSQAADLATLVSAAAANPLRPTGRDS